jgi:hypothetical protein
MSDNSSAAAQQLTLVHVLTGLNLQAQHHAPPNARNQVFIMVGRVQN